MEKFLENLQEAESLIRKADHLIYSAFPLTKDKRILISSLERLRDCVVKCISAVLQYEYLYKRIKLYKDARANMRTFETKCSGKYGLDESDIGRIKSLFDFYELHKNSSMEFFRDEGVFIMAGSPVPTKLGISDLKEFLSVARKLFNNMKVVILDNRG